MPDIIHRIGIKAPRAKVFEALSTIKGLAGWWTKDTMGEARTGGKIDFTFRNTEGQEIGSMKMQVVNQEQPEIVHWRCIGGPEEWMGTDITFELTQDKDMAILMFGHRNWKKPVEFMAHCSMKWATFLLSLKDLVEKGKGHPSPKDLKIDNWN